MWMNLPGSAKTRPAVAACFLLICSLALGTVPAQGKEAVPQAGPREAADAQITLSGKVYCSLKHPVPLPFAGVITGVPAKIGQPVKAGETLARYRLTPEAALALHRRLAPPRLTELEAKLAEVDRNLGEVDAKLQSSRQLAQHQLASEKALTQAREHHRQLLKQRQVLAASLGQERRLAKEELAVIREQLGTSISPGHVSGETFGLLRAPLDGHVIWISPDLKEGAQLSPAPVAFLVGVLDPVIIRAKVHEIEAMQLKVGDSASITLESLPGRTFTARLIRLPWVTAAPVLDQPAYFDAEFEAPNPNLALREGLTARIVINKSR